MGLALDGELNSVYVACKFFVRRGSSRSLYVRGGKFETEQPATWETGDANGDGVFNTSDLVAMFQGGGFEKGPRGVRAVLEPYGVLSFFGVLSLFMFRLGSLIIR